MPLIEKSGSIEAIFNESEAAWTSLCSDFNIRPDLFDRKAAIDKTGRELEMMDKHHISLCSVDHYNYPNLLKQCPDAPLVFFYKGVLETEDVKYLAVVGTRKASERCIKRVELVLKELHEMGHRPVIVSGLAFGIDASAHHACLKHRLKTYAVLGHGLHMIYPAAHKQMAEKILSEGGALISEFSCDNATHRGNFLQRNRIIAGLSHATWIVESAEKGGAMATARMALSYDRDVMTLPARPEDKMSAGCNALIKQNIAALVENANDVARILDLPYIQSPEQMSLNLFQADESESLVLKVLTEENGMNIDELSIFTGIPVNELASILLKLELEEVVSSLPGKHYVVN